MHDGACFHVFPQLYVHRSGRTARASTEGISVMLVGPEDTPHYKRICRMLNRSESTGVLVIMLIQCDL